MMDSTASPFNQQGRILIILMAVPLSFFLWILPTGLALFGLLLISLVALTVSIHFKNSLIAIFSASYIFRLILIFIDSKLGVLPVPPISAGHNQRAIELITSWGEGAIFGVLPNLDPMRLIMAHILSPFYIIFGKSQVSGRIAIATFSIFIGYLIYRIARNVIERQTAVYASALVLFWPTIAYRSVVIQREVLITVALLSFLWASIKAINNFSFFALLIALLSILTISIFRQENLLLFAAVIGVICLIKGRRRPYYLAGLVFMALPFFVYFTYNFNQFTGHGTMLSPSALDSFAYGRAHGDAVYLLGLHYETWLDVILYAPMKVLYFLYTPFPWQVEGITELFVGISAIALLAVTLFVRRGIAMLRDRPYYLGILLSYLLTGVVTYSIIEMNYGAAVRRRIQFIPILLLLAVIGLSNVEFDVRWRRR